MKKNSKVELVILTHQYEIIGGAEKALIEMVEYLHEQGRTMHLVVGNEGSFSKHLKKLDIAYSIMYLPFWAHGGDDPSPFRFSSLNPAVNTCLQLVELLEATQPTLCVTNTIVVPWLAYASALAGVPHAWMIHELGSAGLNLRYAMGEEQTLRSIDTFSDIIFFNSAYTEQYYAPHFNANRPSGIVYPGGGNISKETIKNPFRPNVFKVISVGQIKPQKGQFDSVRAIKRLVEVGISVELILLGKPENKLYYQEMRTYIKEHNLMSNVKLLGHKPNPVSYVKHADVAIVSSTNDAFGRVTVEAMLAKKPVIAAASAGSLEIIEDGKTGLFYQPGNYGQLAVHLKLLLENKDIAEKIASNGYLHASRSYSDDARFTPFIDYLDSHPQRSALSLMPLRSSFDDFTNTVSLLGYERERIAHIERTRLWRIRTRLKKFLK